MSKAYLIAGLGYGDEGKGSIVDFLVRKLGTDLVVRYNGGGQAAHNVVLVHGTHHTFSQFGSGTFAGAKTLLSRHCLVNPLSILTEAEHLISLGVHDCTIFENLYIDADAIIVTPFHRAANRIREMSRGPNRHGSCGVGIGETRQDALENRDLILRVKDLNLPNRMLHSKLSYIQDGKFQQLKDVLKEIPPIGNDYHMLTATGVCEEILHRYCMFPRRTFISSHQADLLLHQAHNPVFEGAQGVLLDETFGFHPWTTWTDTTFYNALRLLNDADLKEYETIGVVRTYATRHGPGPFVSEDPSLKFEYATKDHNQENQWQGEFRLGYFDAVATRYALGVLGGVDGLAITHLDEVPRGLCVAYNPPNVKDAKMFAMHGGIDKYNRLLDLYVNPSRKPNHLDYQTALGKFLMECSPVIRWDSTRGFITEKISELLDTKVLIWSKGPTWRDKEHKEPITHYSWYVD